MTITSDFETHTSVAGIVGPFPEGAEVTLSCQVLGGRPRPEVTWWYEGSLLDDVSEVKSGQVTRNALSLYPLTRRDLNKTLVCRALNTHLTPPLTEAVIIDMKYSATSVRLVTGSDGLVRLVEGVPGTITCVGEGARPPARLLWWKDGLPFTYPAQVSAHPALGQCSLCPQVIGLLEQVSTLLEQFSVLFVQVCGLPVQVCCLPVQVCCLPVQVCGLPVQVCGLPVQVCNTSNI
nr:synaptogenesis protein syg-2-like [Cherax quadricarinatus]